MSLCACHSVFMRFLFLYRPEEYELWQAVRHASTQGFLFRNMTWFIYCCHVSPLFTQYWNIYEPPRNITSSSHAAGQYLTKSRLLPRIHSVRLNGIYFTYSSRFNHTETLFSVKKTMCRLKLSSQSFSWKTKVYY